MVQRLARFSFVFIMMHPAGCYCKLIVIVYARMRELQTDNSLTACCAVLQQ
jgi:hypothetical protein